MSGWNGQVSAKVDVTTHIMQENISLLMENDQKLTNIYERSDSLQVDAEKFEKTSKDLANKMWWKKCKMWSLIGLAGALVAGTILTPIILYIKKGSETAHIAVDSVGGHDQGGEGEAP